MVPAPKAAATPVTTPGAGAAPDPDPGLATIVRRGRPLDADRTPAILDAVLELLHDTGYDRLRVQDVAEHAGVGLGTIYRRWPTKQALVIDALECGRGTSEKFPSTGDPRADVVAAFRGMARDLNAKGDLIGFLASMRSEPAVAESFRGTALAQMRGRLRELIAAARGSDDPQLDLLTDVGPSLLLFRLAIAGDVCDPEALADEISSFVLDR